MSNRQPKYKNQKRSEGNEGHHKPGADDAIWAKNPIDSLPDSSSSTSSIGGGGVVPSWRSNTHSRNDSPKFDTQSFQGGSCGSFNLNKQKNNNYKTYHVQGIQHQQPQDDTYKNSQSAKMNNQLGNDLPHSKPFQKGGKNNYYQNSATDSQQPPRRPFKHQQSGGSSSHEPSWSSNTSKPLYVLKDTSDSPKSSSSITSQSSGKSGKVLLDQFPTLQTVCAVTTSATTLGKNEKVLAPSLSTITAVESAEVVPPLTVSTAQTHMPECYSKQQQLRFLEKSENSSSSTTISAASGGLQFLSRKKTNASLQEASTLASTVAIAIPLLEGQGDIFSKTTECTTTSETSRSSPSLSVSSCRSSASTSTTQQPLHQAIVSPLLVTFPQQLQQQLEQQPSKDPLVQFEIKLPQNKNLRVCLEEEHFEKDIVDAHINDQLDSSTIESSTRLELKLKILDEILSNISSSSLKFSSVKLTGSAFSQIISLLAVTQRQRFPDSELAQAISAIANTLQQLTSSQQISQSFASHSHKGNNPTNNNNNNTVYQQRDQPIGLQQIPFQHPSTLHPQQQQMMAYYQYPGKQNVPQQQVQNSQPNFQFPYIDSSLNQKTGQQQQPPTSQQQYPYQGMFYPSQTAMLPQNFTQMPYYNQYYNQQYQQSQQPNQQQQQPYQKNPRVYNNYQGNQFNGGISSKQQMGKKNGFKQMQINPNSIGNGFIPSLPDE